MEPIVRKYKPGDAPKIYEFFQKHTHYKRDAEFWVWINRLLSNDTLIEVIEHNEQIVGHFAALPTTLTVCGEKVKAAMTLHIIIDPEFRDIQLLFKLIKQLHIQIKDEGYALTFGFPNQNMRPISQTFEKAKEISLFNAYELKSCDLTDAETNMFNLQENNTLSTEILFHINELFELQTTPDNRISLTKNAKYFLTRYAIHPQKLYSFITIKNKTNDNVEGVFVCKKFTKDNDTYFHIVDYVVRNEENLKEILETILGENKTTSTYFSFWKGTEKFELAITQIGFNQTGFDTYLGVKITDKEKLSPKQLETIHNFNNWDLVMGDSDAF